MTNREKYGEQILDILARNGEIRVAFDKESNMICHCDDISCRNCLFSGRYCCCTVARKEWLSAEYEEPKKITIPKDTSVDAKILVSDDGTYWCPRHFARFTEDGKVDCWDAGRTSWTVDITCTWEYAKLPEEEE